MDDVTREAIDAASQKAAEQAAEQALEAIKPYFDEKAEEVKRHMDVRAEALEQQLSGLADLVERDDEKMEDHERRISRLKDHAGLPTLEPAVEDRDAPRPHPLRDPAGCGRIYSYCATHRDSSSAAFSCRSTVLRLRTEFK